MPVSMRDVARRAGVSTTTVSHVLNKTRTVAKETSQRVSQAVEELSYFKNTSARLLVRGQSDLMGLIISDIENPFFADLIRSYERACAARELEVLLCATNYDPLLAQAAVRRMIENRVRGVAVMTSQFEAQLEAQLISKNIPLVLLGTARPTRRYRSHIGIDYQKGASQAIEHLCGLGHRAIAIASGPQTKLSAVAHKEAILRALERAGCRPFRVIEGDDRPESGAGIARELLSSPPRPTAIFCGSDRMAIGAMGAAMSLGLRVPEDVSVIGADDVWMARYSYPPLTTVRLSREILGELAFRVLSKMLNSKLRMGTEHTLDTELIVRQSTGPAKPARKKTAAERTRIRK
jgi:DNA-binding LacI/PurR family transcriptional regulator